MYRTLWQVLFLVFFIFLVKRNILPLGKGLIMMYNKDGPLFTGFLHAVTGLFTNRYYVRKAALSYVRFFQKTSCISVQE